jgi:hypothetical protein
MARLTWAYCHTAGKRSGTEPHMTPCRGIQGHRRRTTCCYSRSPGGLTPDFLTLSRGASNLANVQDFVVHFSRQRLRLQRPSESTGCEILGKAEFMHPGGFVKDRAALGIITDAEKSGRLGHTSRRGIICTMRRRQASEALRITARSKLRSPWPLTPQSQLLVATFTLTLSA